MPRHIYKPSYPFQRCLTNLNNLLFFLLLLWEIYLSRNNNCLINNHSQSIAILLFNKLILLLLLRLLKTHSVAESHEDKYWVRNGIGNRSKQRPSLNGPFRRWYAIAYNIYCCNDHLNPIFTALSRLCFILTHYFLIHHLLFVCFLFVFVLFLFLFFCFVFV